MATSIPKNVTLDSRISPLRSIGSPDGKLRSPRSVDGFVREHQLEMDITWYNHHNQPLSTIITITSTIITRNNGISTIIEIKHHENHFQPAIMEFSIYIDDLTEFDDIWLPVWIHGDFLSSTNMRVSWIGIQLSCYQQVQITSCPTRIHLKFGEGAGLFDPWNSRMKRFWPARIFRISTRNNIL